MTEPSEEMLDTMTGTPVDTDETAEDVADVTNETAENASVTSDHAWVGDSAEVLRFFRTTAFVEFKDKIVRYQLPGSIQKEIVSFDRAKVMSAGAYRLSPVGPVRAGRGSKKSKKHQKPARTTATRIKARHQLQDVRTKFEPEG